VDGAACYVVVVVVVVVVRMVLHAMKIAIAADAVLV